MLKKILFLLAILLFLAFIFFSYLVARERFTQFDFDMTVKFQDRLPHRVDLPFSYLSVLGSAEVSMAIWFIILLYMLVKRFWFAAAALLLLPLGLVIEIFGKAFVLHPGPPHMFYRGVIKFDFPSNFVPVDYSYPSGHAFRTTFLSIFLMGYFYFRHPFKRQLFLIPPFILLSFLMIISRIYLGEHWTTDVIGGSLLGVSLGLMASIFIPQKKHAAIATHQGSSK